jgi:anti-sigma B factor antagonist
MFLTTRITEHDECTVVSVDGELDMSTAPELHDVLAAARRAREVDIVLDVGGLEFCDSAGLAVFVRAHNELEASGRRLIVAAPTPTVARILELSGVSQVIPTTTGADEARTMVTNG